MLISKLAFWKPGRSQCAEPPPLPRIRRIWLGDNRQNRTLMGLDGQRLRRVGELALVTGTGSLLDPPPFTDDMPADENHFFLPIRFILPFDRPPVVSCFLSIKPDNPADLIAAARPLDISRTGFVMSLSGSAQFGQVPQRFAWFAAEARAVHQDHPQPPQTLSDGTLDLPV